MKTEPKQISRYYCSCHFTPRRLAKRPNENSIMQSLSFNSKQSNRFVSTDGQKCTAIETNKNHHRYLEY